MKKKPTINGYVLAVTDLLTALVVVFAALAVLAINSAQSKHEASIKGSLIITQYWQKDANADVDTWMLGPGESQPVGYSHKHGYHCDLIRDDLGHARDPESRNMENIICRGAPAGEYIINSVLFALYSPPMPIHVWITVQDGSGDILLHEDGELTYEHQEITLARFRLDNAGNIVPGSVNKLPMALYEASR